MKTELIHLQIDRDGPRVCLSARSADGARRLSVTLQHRSAAALGTLTREAAHAEEEASFELSVRGEWVMSDDTKGHLNASPVPRAP